MSDRRLPPTLGEIIRKQRELAELPMRQLAAMVGISGPYLSQIERGLRAPSEQVLGSIAKSLQTSAEALQQQAEALAPHRPVPSEVLADVYTALTEVTVARRRRGRSDDGVGPGTVNGSGPDEE